jgi:hypothetical protein
MGEDKIVRWDGFFAFYTIHGHVCGILHHEAHEGHEEKI